MSQATTYYVRTDGNDANAGTANTAEGAWRSIDHGQPTCLLEGTQPGQAEIKVARAEQFPAHGTLLLGNTRVTYSGRTSMAFTGCQGTPGVGAGTVVASADWAPPAAGDSVMVAAGAYLAPLDVSTYWESNATVVITAGGTPDKPVTFQGVGLPVVDGRHLANGWRVKTNFVVIDGFEMRDCGISLWQSAGSVIRNCRMHGGNAGGINARYCKNLDIAGNTIWDLQGAWSESPITIGDSTSCAIHQNTIAQCGRSAIVFFGDGKPGHKIYANLLTRCDCAIEANKTELEPQNVSGNCVWKNGDLGWPWEWDSKGTNHYKGLNFTPADIVADPCIVNWDATSPDYLQVYQGGPCARDGKLIGAGVAADYPTIPRLPGENLLANPGFESVWYGWKGSTWHQNDGVAAYWEIVPADGADGHYCLHLVNQPQKDTLQPRVTSTAVLIDRGRPVTLSFRARTDGGTALLAGVMAPNGPSIEQRFQISPTWQTYSATFTLPPWYPNTVAVSFDPPWDCKFFIDDVKLEEGATATPFSPSVELALATPVAGMLVAPGAPLPLKLINRGDAVQHVTLTLTLETPLGQARTLHKDVPLLAPGEQALPVALPPTLAGAVLLRYEIAQGATPLARGAYRWTIGTPPAPGRNRDFFAATPSPDHFAPNALWAAQQKTIFELGIGTFHQYFGIDGMVDYCKNPVSSAAIDAARAIGLQWLWTLDDSVLFTGKRAFAPMPGKLGQAGEELKIDGAKDARVTPAQLDVWRQWLSALAQQYGDRVKYWEILNEPNMYVNGDEYLRILQGSSDAIRKAAPRATIIGGSVVNGFRGDLWTKTITQGFHAFDMFSYHPYRFGVHDPEFAEGYRHDLYQAKEDLLKVGSTSRVFLTEEGDNFGPTLSDWAPQETLEAQYLSRMYVTALGENCAGYNYHMLFSLVRDDNITPNLGLVAMHTMSSLLSNAEPLGRLKTAPDYVAYLFKAGEHSAIVGVWPLYSQYVAPAAVTLATTVPVNAQNLFGNPIAVTTHEDTRQFLLGRELAYLVFPQSTPDEAKAIVERAFATREITPAP
jgi:parallel beta-helix repeat protein